MTINTDAIGDGLKGGSDVKYLGFTVGEVSSIAVRDRGAAVKINLTGSGNDLVLRQGMTVNYTSSNALGPTALEIVDPGQGPPIGSGGSVYVSRLQSEQTSVSTLVRKISTLVEALDQPSFEAVVRFIVEDSQAMADSGRLVFQIAQLTRDVQKRPVGEDLEIAANLSTGVADFMTPFVPGVLKNVDIADFFATQQNIDRTKSNLGDTGKVLFGGLGGLLDKNYPALSSLLDVGLDLARPVARSASGLVRTVYTIPQILDGIDKALPKFNERVQLQLALVVQTSPALQGALRMGGCHSMTLRSLTPTIIKIVAFIALIGVLSYVIIAILQPTNEGSPSSQRSAVFADASGLKPRDGVRLAGVKVGYVTAVDLEGSTAIVRFQLDDGVAITPATTAAVRYQNLLGQRYVELINAGQGADQDSITQVALEKTVPSFDVSTLFNSFKPVFDTLNTAEINELQSNLLRVAQGDGRGIAPVMKQVANITDYGNQRSEIITNIVTSLGAGVRPVDGALR
nr:MlaD family protein [Gordonia sp. LAM0048]